MVITMENENIPVLQPEEEVNSAAVCDEGEQLSVCNCENEEVVTLCEADDAEETEESEEEVPETHKEMFTRKCNEVKAACRSTASRLVTDWKEANGNPHIKQTCVMQVDIYRSPEDEAPIDTFRTERVKSFSARSLAVIGAAALVVSCTVETIVKKLLK